MAMVLYQAKPLFFDRADAGKRLAERLRHYEGSQTVVFAIPHGGYPCSLDLIPLPPGTVFFKSEG